MADYIGTPEIIIPGTGAFVITKADAVDLVDDVGNTLSYTDVLYAVWVGGAGAVKVTAADGSTPTFSAVPAGSILPVLCSRVWSTGTAATAMYAIKGS